MKKYLIAAILLWAVPVVAQQSSQEQALGAKLMEEISQNVQYRAALIGEQTKVRDLQVQIDKYKADDKLKKKDSDVPSSSQKK